MDKNISLKVKNFQTVNWLKNRFKNQVKDKYILNEKELKEQTMMKAVFKSIDRDNSKFLDRQELYDMFKRYGINITKTKLREFFKRIDQDEDDKLNWNDFRQALQNQEALQMFVELMRKIRESSEKKTKQNEFNFVPLSFPNMIQYMNYCVLREELIQKIKSEQLTTQQKVKQCKNLLSLEDICYKKIIDFKDEEEEEQSDDAFLKLIKKNNDPQQIAILKRLQEKEQNLQRQNRIRKLSSSQYYKTDSDQTNRSIRKSYQSSKQESIKISQPEFKLIDQFVNENQKQLPQINTENKKTLSIQQALQITERLNLNESYNQYVFNCNHLKQQSCTTDTKRGQQKKNQYLLNSKSPLIITQKSKFRSPQRIRVISQTEIKRNDTKNEF